MSEWLTYRLSDFLMFSSETYHRLFARYNLEVWPWQLVLLALGAALVGLLRPGSGRSNRIATALLAPCWLLVAWLFHWERFREIHLAAGWFAAASVLQALLLLGASMPRRRGLWQAAVIPPDIMGVGFVLFGVLLQPLIGPVLGRPWEATQWFGLAPDPTATVTLGVLLATRSRRVLWLIPVLYCVVSGATLWAMESPDAWVPPVVALVAVARRPFARVFDHSTESALDNDRLPP